MTITAIIDPVAVSSSGLFVTTPPSAPSLSLSSSGTTITATIDGDTSVTNYLLYKKPSQTAWQSGGDRSGDGTIQVADLETGVSYEFVAYSQSASGLNSLPSPAAVATLTAASTNQIDTELTSAFSVMLDEFGEDVKYYPAGGGVREIVAIVDRDPEGSVGGTPYGITHKAVIEVANDATDGISSSEIDCGGDEIEFATRLGETAQRRRITKILGQDAGSLELAMN